MNLASENFNGMADEGDTPSWWNPSNAFAGSVSSTGSLLTVYGVSSYAEHREAWFADAVDSVLYVRVSAPYASGQSNYFSLRDASNNYRISVAMGYSWVTGLQTLGTIGLIANGGATKFDIATGLDYSTPVDLAFHVDRNRSCISVYKMVVGEWVFVSAITGLTLNDVSRFTLGINNVSSASSITLDHALVCRPGMIAFGDSIAAGHTLFDPAPAYYTGNDDNNSTWMRHAQIGRNVRNSLIVNKGVGGNTSAQLLARIAEVTAHRPEVVFLHASSNDLQAGVSQATRTSNHQAIINAITAAGATCYLLNGIYANANYSAWPGHAAYMLDWWTNYAPGLTGLAGSIDIMQAVVDSSGVIDPTLAQADGIHPTIAGYTAIGNYIAAAI